MKDKGMNVYPHKFHVTISLRDFIDKYGHLTAGQRLDDEEVSLSGRIYGKRAYGAKLYFYDLQSDGAKLQVLANANFWKGEEDFKEFHTNVKRGDIVGIVGKVMQTKYL